MKITLIQSLVGINTPTYYIEKEIILMSGYYVGIEQDIKTADYDPMITTAENVGIFLRALNEGSLFEEGEQEGNLYSICEYYAGLVVLYKIEK